ncbi:hypothetical protein [Devosia sp. FJ2-5-3]|uniref:hypothetical protein n=1 Tax=Devosia sp. FJ2-5-3 TaxID=2976680 RepID=UPI0023D8AB15|nr:hypothetical protein [Devosia sp. FJ2-5-3]WEJ59433.1 hypothetical protein N0P34_05270 [Devosia sp. FJ2-5-3]
MTPTPRPPHKKPAPAARDGLGRRQGITMAIGLVLGACAGGIMGSQVNLAGAAIGALLGAAAGGTLGLVIWH